MKGNVEQQYQPQIEYLFFSSWVLYSSMPNVSKAKGALHDQIIDSKAQSHEN
tara:strand:- start:135 stop:290 length:156 start_codon:yes stop_codon:yes gene_type:complete